MSVVQIVAVLSVFASAPFAVGWLLMQVRSKKNRKGRTLLKERLSKIQW